MPAAARAQQVSVQVTPLRVELKTAPGGATTQAVTLVNEGHDPVRVHAALSDWSLARDGTPQFAPADPASPASASAWLRVTPAEFTAQPGVETAVRFTIDVPAAALPGGYRSAIMFEFMPPGAEPALVSKGVAFRSRIATVIYVTIGTPVPSVDLVDLQPQLKDGQPAAVVATLKNTGTVHVRTRGHVTVYGPDDRVVRRLSLPDVPVLPGGVRDLVVPLSDEAQPAALAPGRYRVEVRVDVGMPEVLVGEIPLIVTG